MADQPMKWGILGAANFALNEMAPAIHLARDCVLTAVASRSPEKAAPFAALAPGLRVFDDYDALLADPEIDAVYVPLPNSLHIEWTLKALAAGKHVLTEKPMAMEAGGFEEVIAARDASGLVAAEAYVLLHHPQWQHAKKVIADGAIGRLTHVQGAFCYNNSGDPGNIRNAAEMGGGGLPDIGVYPFGATRFVTGEEPQDVSARIEWENGVDTVADVSATFPGFTFSALISMRVRLFQEMTFFGSDGVLRLTAPFNAGNYGEAAVYLTTEDGTQKRLFTHGKQYVAQVEAFAHSVRTGAPFPCPLEFSQGTQVMIDMAYASAKS